MFIDTVLIKVASRCNLDCSYCYIYHMGDEAWRTMPKRMDPGLGDTIASELAELMAAQGRPFSVVLHGGEPLLLGADGLHRFLRSLRAALPGKCGISIQTNGVLLSEAVIDMLAEYDVTVSVSLDGPADVHDRNRVDIKGRPTHGAVMQGLAKLTSHQSGRRLFSGVLAVVDPASLPDAVYGFFKDLGVPSVDFLYRDGNHDNLPPGKLSFGSVEYGHWMVRILDLYLADREPFRIRLLDDLIRLALGGAAVKEGVGLTDYGILVIDTDGTVKKNDTLKSSPNGDGFESSWAVGRDSLHDIALSQEFQAYHVAQRPSAPECLACRELSICGGGMVTHRFREGSGYRNPTVFCSDQKHLIGAIRDRVRTLMSAAA